MFHRGNPSFAVTAMDNGVFMVPWQHLPPWDACQRNMAFQREQQIAKAEQLLAARRQHLSSMILELNYIIAMKKKASPLDNKCLFSSSNGGFNNRASI